jgi:hypothetical protein
MPDSNNFAAELQNLISTHLEAGADSDEVKAALNAALEELEADNGEEAEED